MWASREPTPRSARGRVRHTGSSRRRRSRPAQARGNRGSRDPDRKFGRVNGHERTHREDADRLDLDVTSDIVASPARKGAGSQPEHRRAFPRAVAARPWGWPSTSRLATASTRTSSVCRAVSSDMRSPRSIPSRGTAMASRSRPVAARAAAQNRTVTGATTSAGAGADGIPASPYFPVGQDVSITGPDGARLSSLGGLAFAPDECSGAQHRSAAGAGATQPPRAGPPRRAGFALVAPPSVMPSSSTLDAISRKSRRCVVCFGPPGCRRRSLPS